LVIPRDLSYFIFVLVLFILFICYYEFDFGLIYYIGYDFALFAYILNLMFLVYFDYMLGIVGLDLYSNIGLKMATGPRSPITHGEFSY
jgi:hypothetical protein